MPRLPEPPQPACSSVAPPPVDAASESARAAAARRFVVAGQPGPGPEGVPEDGLEAQMQRAWINLFDAMKAAGYEKCHLVKTTVCVTEGGHLNLYRTIRDRMLQGHPAPSAYLHVPGLGAPNHLVEIEAEVMKPKA
ncbi:MAG: RidA family protein [Hyphomicrobiaceae bacterium]|nr:MAG: RidA family protein [Hyphomicrobiaceae bacterium]